jgi:hypothetical protein
MNRSENSDPCFNKKAGLNTYSLDSQNNHALQIHSRSFIVTITPNKKANLNAIIWSYEKLYVPSRELIVYSQLL